MKANINSKKNSNKENNSGIILSIGMIVKNEEKVLERCLKSLQPLMEAIPSELIISDTGSTDSSVEIAKKYTDNVFHFEWINDFAAARNSTLEKAKGQWYMFIDADEYFDEKISEIIYFFKTPDLYTKYKTAEIVVRNYLDDAKITYNDTNLPRFHKIDDSDDPVHFVGSVHEGIWIREPFAHFPVILHHTGYCYSSDQQNMDKMNRNLVLMREEYKKDPKNLRMLCHLIDGCTYEDEEIEKYIPEALEIAKNKRNDMYSNIAYMQAILHYQNISPNYALELCYEYCNTLSDYEKYVASVAVIMLKAKLLSALGRYDESYEAFVEYDRLYKDYQDEKLKLNDLSAHGVVGLTEYEYIKANYMMALNLKKLKRYDEAFGILSKFDVSDLKNDSFREFLGTIREICKEKSEYIQMGYYYGEVLKTNDRDKISLALFMLESTYYSIVGQKKRESFAVDIINSGVSGRYTELMKLVVSGNEERFTERLKVFISSVDDWSDGYSEVIYMAVKYKIDMCNIADRMKTSVMREKIQQVATAHDDFAEYVYEYGVPENNLDTIKRFFWVVALHEKASYRAFELNEWEKYELYNRFVNLLGDYVMNIYNPELLNDEDIDVLPVYHQFGYHMHGAMVAFNSGNAVEYVRKLKKALLSCESMKEIVQFLLEQFKKNM